MLRFCGQYYDARAPEYEQIYYRDMPERQQELRDEAGFLRDISARREILEIACVGVPGVPTEPPLEADVIKKLLE